ncbi:ribosomal RNA processing protein 1 homolog A [Rhinichthys klamathensis goyatoka]|uniref:ribosomal RNA processing protein 1 homolog A n=1 Tax=Rhinichthys klamathensis goyatoka TaxID=3034132 RepID=UPI0024B4C995|nr:ribosomal RNA processing protein 1 homolog A [Rhinichthys klamathensis goyatoka]
MAPIQAAEIIFAQKLASNEKPERSKALLKLRKYIRVRSGRAQGGFGEDELMKIWKGLFYCVWMQDMPLLQEELSTKISRLLHSFQTLDSQLLFFKAFLQTMKREWTGIDRLRMDKFFQLVRFVFREVFEMLKRRQWESSVLAEFLQLFSAQLLHGSGSAPAGLVLHVLDLYTAELARVGSAQLTAEQNLTFIEPFCKSMAKTKDRVLLKAIGSNVFDTIVDQVPFAIEDLLREIRQAKGEELDASGGSETSTERKTKPRSKKRTEDAQDNGGNENVLKFDYGAIADKLFEVASNSNIPSFNRSKIYKFVKIFRDLSEGLFPQDKVEDVSTDEEDYSENRRRKNRKKLAKKGQTADTNQKNKKGKKKKRKNGSLKSVEGEADQQTPVESTDPDLTQSNADRDGEDKPGELKAGDADVDSLSAGVEDQRDSQETPIASRKTLIKRKKKQRDPAVVEPEPSANGDAHQELQVPALSTAGNMMKKKLKKNPAAVEPEPSANGDAHQELQVPALSTAGNMMKKKLKKNPAAVEPEPSANGDAHQELQVPALSTAGNMMKKKLKKNPAAVEPEPSANGDPHQELQVPALSTAGNIKKKKQKQKSGPAEQIQPGKKRRVKDEDVQVNGQAGETGGKRLKLTSEAGEHQLKPRQFVLRQKKAPAPLFCKAAGYMLSKKILPKKVRFGLKNNKTMEFRKSDRSSRVGVASQARVPFDPQRTPKTSVLKSPSPSPAGTRRATAADFF